MPANCAFYGCPTSRSYNLSLFNIPAIGASDGEHTKALKQNAWDEWLRLILRTREMTPALKTRIDANNVYLCELHFKEDCVLTSKKFYIIYAYILKLSRLIEFEGNFMNIFIR